MTMENGRNEGAVPDNNDEELHTVVYDWDTILGSLKLDLWPDSPVNQPLMSEPIQSELPLSGSSYDNNDIGSPGYQPLGWYCFQPQPTQPWSYFDPQPMQPWSYSHQASAPYSPSATLAPIDPWYDGGYCNFHDWW